MKVCIERFDYQEKQTLGQLYVYNDKGELLFHCYTLELPWKENQRSLSCIPKGRYNVIKHHSPKFKKSFWIRNVEGRSEILIHKGNYHRDIRGCILAGSGLIDIDGDGHADVTSSTATIGKLYRILPDEFELTIQNK